MSVITDELNSLTPVIPAKAGIHLSARRLLETRHAQSWIPAFAGMTRVEGFLHRSSVLHDGLPEQVRQ